LAESNEKVYFPAHTEKVTPFLTRRQVYFLPIDSAGICNISLKYFKIYTRNISAKM